MADGDRNDRYSSHAPGANGKVPGAAAPPSQHMTLEELSLFNEYLSAHFGLHFPEHKREILEFALRPRLEAHGLKGFMEYFILLQYGAGDEREALARAVTNNETYFFRETLQLETLFGEALETFKRESAVPGVLNLLCAGCSSGEEAYTVSIFAKENQYRMWGTEVQIYAFDLDTTRLEVARSCRYSATSFRMVDKEKMERYFTKPREGYREVKAAYRSGITYAWGNILDLYSYYRGIPFDAIFCRNVLIYFSESSLHKAVENFARCLRPGGLLFLGHSESIIGVSHRFEPFRLGPCIVYRRTP